MMNIQKRGNKLALLYDELFLNTRVAAANKILKSRLGASSLLQVINNSQQNYFNINNKYYSTKTEAIVSLHDIVEYKSGNTNINPYQGLLKGKENLYLEFGNGKIYPAQSEYDKYIDICDWKSRIKQIIKEELVAECTYDIGVVGHDILNEEYITYGKHFLINNESDISAVITRIEGNIFVNSLSFNSGEIGVAENKEELESGMRLIVFVIRSVSFNDKIKNLVNKGL